jgi:hypothetical protein
MSTFHLADARDTVMSKNASSPRILAITAGLLLAPSAAFAYVDPGSGMLLWQGLLAAIGAVIVFVRNPIKVVKAFFERLRRK